VIHVSGRKELDLPAQVLSDDGATEILRIWKNPDNLTITLKTTWSDPGAWGLVLADLARHVANAYESEGVQSAKSAERQIRAALLAELESPTSDVDPMIMQ